MTGRYAEPGQVVNPGQKNVTIARPEIREAVFSVPSDVADTLLGHNDFEMMVRLDASTVIKAVAVRVVDPAADPNTRTRTVYLTLDNPPPAFRLGITISVTLQKTISPRIDLPATALLERDGKTRYGSWRSKPARPTRRFPARRRRCIARCGRNRRDVGPSGRRTNCRGRCP